MMPIASPEHAWQACRNSWALILLVLFTSATATTLGMTYIYTLARSRNNQVFAAPFWVPVLGHGISFIRNPHNFLRSIRDTFGLIPVRLNLASKQMTFIPHGSKLMTAFLNSRELHTEPLAEEVLCSGFNMPPADMELLLNKGSRTTFRPITGSEKQDPGQRPFYTLHRLLHDLLKGPTLVRMLDITFANLIPSLEAKAEKCEDWIVVPDLYEFVRDELFTATIRSLCGDYILEVAPNFGRDFWAFDQHSPLMFKKLPKWAIPEAFAARNRCLQGIQDWRIRAQKEFDWDNLDLVNENWEPVWGSRLMRARQQITQTLGLSPEGMAALDLGMIWASLSNTIPASFWPLFATLTSKNLTERVIAETSPAFEPGRLLFDREKLGAGKLVNSMYHESLRYCTAIAIAHAPYPQQYQLGGYNFTQKDVLFAFTRSAHYDETFWNTGRVLTNGKREHPVDKFWAERFLEYPDDAASGPIRKKDEAIYRSAKPAERTAEDDRHAKLVTNSIQAHFFPYGGGQNICAGRYFAKSEMIATVAMFLRAFEIELVDPSIVEKVKPDMHYVLTGALPPDRKVPVRIRKRML